jgi:multisubunit Na+/H+ antiporter MnhG subunit
VLNFLLNPITYVSALFALLGVAARLLSRKLEWRLSAHHLFYGAVFMLVMGVVAAYSMSRIPPEEMQKLH